MTDLKTLHQKRGNLKARLTSFQKYLNKAQENVGEIEWRNLEARMNSIIPILDNFYELQNEIECISDENHGEIEERESFEDIYFDLISRANQIKKQNHVNCDKKQLHRQLEFDPNASPSSSKSVNVTLPTINLPTFDGAFSHWREYCDAFTSLIHLNNDIPEGRKLNYLKSSLEGEPVDLLRPLEITDENYAIAWEKLKKKYDNKRKIVYTHVRTLLDLSPVSRDTLHNLQKFVNTIETHVECLKTWNQPVDSWNALLVPVLLSKLDIYTNKEWESRINKGVTNYDHIPTVFELLEFLNEKVNTLDAISVKQLDTSKTPSNTYNKVRTTKSFTTVNNVCIICQGEHTISQCEIFSKLNSRERNAKVRELKLCINCLRKGHYLQDCQSKNKCKLCFKQHHTLILVPSPQSNGTKTTDNQTIANFSSRIASNVQVILSTARVHVLRTKNEIHELRVLLDSASQSHFITENMCNLLKLKKEKVDINVTGISNGTLGISHQAQLTIKSRHNNFQETITCLVVPKITDMIPMCTLNTKQFQIPANLKLADPTYDQPGPIDVLIGAGLFWDLLCIGQIKTPNNPILQKTKFGWIVSGNLANQHREEKITRKTLLVANSLQDQVERFWKMDEFIETKEEYTKEEQYCLDFFEQTTTRDHDGRFVVKIPLKPNMNDLGNSFEIAKSRLISLERRFNNNPDLKREYSKCIQDYINQGHMSRSKKNEPNSFYLPHHALIKETSQTTKLRVVFDGSCQLETGLPINQLHVCRSYNTR